MSRGISPLCAVVIVWSAASLGCKSDHDPAAAFIGQYCDIYKPCCTAAGLPGDGKACRALFASSTSAKAKYDDTAGQACLTGLEQQSGQSGFCTGDIVPPSACTQALGGMMAGTCIQDSDCPASSQGDVRCVSGFVNSVQMRKCQVQIRGAAGSTPCVGSVRAGVTLYSGTITGDIPDQGYLCSSDDGLRCDGTACVALTANGGQCELYTDCVVAAFCDAATGACGARRMPGASCIGEALECQDGAYCDDGTMLCTIKRDMGASCTDNEQCMTGNCLNGACAATPSGGPNVVCGATG
jgi:hypothetical protein